MLYVIMPQKVKIFTHRKGIMTAKNSVQQFIVFNAVMFGDGSTIPLHFGKCDGELTVQGVEEIRITSTNGEDGRKIHFMLPFGGSVVLNDTNNGQRGIKANGEMPLTVEASKVMIVG